MVHANDIHVTCVRLKPKKIRTDNTYVTLIVCGNSTATGRMQKDKKTRVISLDRHSFCANVCLKYVAILRTFCTA